MTRFTAVLFMLASAALAQSTVNQGAPGKFGAWPVTCTNCSGGGSDGGTSSVSVVAPLGSKPAASSVSVAVAADQTVPVSAASLPLPAGAATDSNISARLGTLGQATMSSSTPVTIASDQSVLRSSVTDGTTTAYVTPASTAPTASRTALNVTLSPNSAAVPTVLTSSQSAFTSGYWANPTVYGTLRVSQEGTPEFNDPFDGAVIDVTNRWSAAVVSGGTATQANGSLTLATGTTASSYATIASIGTFNQYGTALDFFGAMLQLEASPGTNTDRFWGLGTAGSNTAAAPLTNAYGFEYDTAGTLRCVIWSAGTRVFSQAVTVPTDGAFHRYGMLRRADVVAFYLDNIELPACTQTFTQAAVNTLSVRLQVINNTTGPGVAPTFNVSSVGLSSSSTISPSISDGVYSWRKATVTTANALSVNVAQLTAGTPGALTMAGGANKALGVGEAAPATNVDKASTALTATGNTGTIAADFGASISALVNVTAVSGTTPTMDIALQESFDNGTTWQDIYHLPRITAISTVAVPAQLIGGRRRWAYTIAGTTPSFTTTITTMQLSHAAPIMRNFFDRTAGVLSGTLSATTAVYNMESCPSVVAYVNIGAATTPGTYQLQVSQDGITWSNASTATPAVASSQVVFSSTSGTRGKFWRLSVSSAASAQTGNYVNLFCSGY